MLLKKIILIFVLIISNLNSKDLEKISLQLDWLHQFQFAGYYIAKEKGFYKDVNLDVEFKEFDFNTKITNDVLNSKSDYAIGKSSLIIDALENKKILLLAAIYQKSPMVLISLDNQKIKKASDLLNKRVMLTNTAKAAVNIKAMLNSQGVKLNNLNFIPHSFKLEDLINNKADAMASYLSNEPYFLKQKDINFTIHDPSDYGFDFYDGILFTSKKELRNNPNRVKKFQEASLKGWKYAFENINESAEIIYKKYNTQNKSLESLIFEAKTLKKLSGINEEILGKIDYEKVEEIKRIYLLLGITNNKEFKTDSLLYNPNKVYLSKKEQRYLEKNEMILLSNSSFPPFTKYENNKLSGIEIDYWNLINKKLGIAKINIKSIEKNSFAIDYLKNNLNYSKFLFSKYDNIDFLKKTNTIDEIPLAIATLNDKTFISSISELSNKKVAITDFTNFTKSLKLQYPEINFVESQNLEESLELLRQEKVFAVVDKLALLSYKISKKSLSNIKISGILKDKFQIKLLANSENTILLNILNKAISSITNKEREEIYKKYYSVVYETSFNYSLLYKIIIPLIFILLIVLILNLRLKQEILKRKNVEKQLTKLANIDALTNIYTRRKIELLYEKEIGRIERYKRKLSIIFMDIDNFKQVNDTLGHAIGDKVLIQIASLVKNSIRNEDYFGRWGGEEFLIVLPETSKEEASKVAYILKDKINSHDFNIQRRVTCSFGVSQFIKGDTVNSLLTRTDNAMYDVKRSGKNNVKAV